jgi:hypothetical protein
MSAVPHDPHAAAAQPASAGDDLFSEVEFGQPSAAIGASLRAELDDATAFLEESAPAAAVPQRSSEYVGAPVLTSEPTPEIAPEHAAVAPRTRSAARTPPARPNLLAMFASGELVPWLLAGVALINLGIGIGALTSTVSEPETTPTAPVDAAPVAGSVAGPAAEPAHAAMPVTLDDGPERRAPLSDAKPEGYRTLELARARLDRGEWERARTMLMSQLAVIDGISEPARSDIEARADFMIAESYRLQAASIHAASEGQGK